MTLNRNIYLLFILLIVSGCSFDTKSKFWTKTENVEKNEVILKEIFKKDRALNSEINPKIIFKLTNNYDNSSSLKDNNGRSNFDSKLEKISKYSFPKIKNFNIIEPEVSFFKDFIFFFDNKGTIYNFKNSTKELVWKKNIYKNKERKLSPSLLLANNGEVLIVADTISKFYALNINDGNLLWENTNSSPFNSEIKIYKDFFFIIDFENILRCFSIKSGEEIWNVKTEQTLLKSQKKLSIVVFNDKVVFNNSVGDINAININNGKLIWQTPTLSRSVYSKIMFFKNSDIVGDSNNLYFSNNQNSFFSIDQKNGFINWSQKVNSSIRPTIVEKLIFTVSEEGYLIILDKQSGTILRSTYIFDSLKKKKNKNVIPVGLVVGKKNIYLTTSNGKLLIIDISNGKAKSVINIDRQKISRPFILNKSLYIIKDNGILKLN